jgi:predicted nucleotidyltransferase
VDKKYDLIFLIIKQYINSLKDLSIIAEKVYLFGSFAKNNYSDDSDIDIAIISNDFSGNRFEDRRRIIPKRRSIDRRIEPIPFLPADFNESSPLVVEIKKNGIELNFA